jgi:outer membrane immunogenic protein
MRRAAITLMAATAVGLCFGASAASAADLGMALKAPPGAVYNWTGCYVGVQAGIGAQQDDFAGGSNGANGYGAVAGGQIGCNYQTGMLVVGIEGDGLWSGIRNTFSEGSNTSIDSISEGAKNNWDADVALRVGVAFDRLLIYGKGGVAWGGFDFRTTEVNPDGCGCTVGYHGTATLPGALIGIGMEYAIPSFQNWTAKIEYNYIAFAQTNVNFPETINGVPDGFVENESYGATKQLIKFGLNYKFLGP